MSGTDCALCVMINVCLTSSHMVSTGFVLVCVAKILSKPFHFFSRMNVLDFPENFPFLALLYFKVSSSYILIPVAIDLNTDIFP